MTQQYLIGELSVRLQQMQAAAAADTAVNLAGLRQQVECSPLAGLSAAAMRAIALADTLCWESLTRGDAEAFARQASISADLRLFGVCACLLAET